MREGGGASRLRTPLESRRMQNKATDAEGKAMRFRRYSGPQLKGPRTVLERGAEGFPPSLGMVHDPPERLYVLGNPAALVEGLAVVGARKATPYGLGCARRFARMAARARGRGGVGRRARLRRGGPPGRARRRMPHGRVSGRRVRPAVSVRASWAVPEHRGRRRGGGVGASMGLSARCPIAFRARNRLIAGLARATLIVEAGLPSGTFSTADEALAANREVLVVPGAITSASSRGANRLDLPGSHAHRRRRHLPRRAASRVFGLLESAEASAPAGRKAAAGPGAPQVQRCPWRSARRRFRPARCRPEPLGIGGELYRRWRCDACMRGPRARALWLMERLVEAEAQGLGRALSRRTVGPGSSA